MTTKKWKIDDIFTIPLGDGNEVLGQVIHFEPLAMNSVICGFTVKLFDSDDIDLSLSDILAVQFTTFDNLDCGVWRVVGRGRPLPHELWAHLEKDRDTGFIGAKILGSGNIRKFLDACVGVRPWDSFADPYYFDKLLLEPSLKPKRAFLKA